MELCSEPEGQIRESQSRAEVASFSKVVMGRGGQWWRGWARQRPLHLGLSVLETQSWRTDRKGRDHSAHLYGNQ